MKNFSCKDINFSWNGSRLEISNSRLKRVIDFSLGLPKTLEMVVDNVAAVESNSGFDFRLAGFSAPEHKVFVSKYQAIRVDFGLNEPTDGEGAWVKVTVFETVRELKLEFRYFMYPALPVVAVQTGITATVTPHIYYNPRQNRQEFKGNDDSHGVNTICDSLQLKDFTVRKSVEFQMRTDYHDEPVLEHDYEENKELYGNILLAADNSGNEFFFLQEAPPSMERRGNEPGDFQVNGNIVSSFGSGITPADITPGRFLETNRTVCGLAVDGDAGKLIKQYLRHRLEVTRNVAGAITVNPWGCGKFPKLLNEEFLKDEIRAAGKVHADTYQIDDGYEHGLLQDLVLRNRKLNTAFWQTRKDLLPQGFAPLLELAKECNVKPSLWFAPSCNREYCDWRESADILLKHFREEGFESFKLDAVIFNSYTAEENFKKLLQALYTESDGKITVNLDVTNGTRGGMFKFTEYGLIFLENRYCCHDWATHPYHPGNTLDNVWNLAKYTRIQNLQIETANPGDCRAEVYTTRDLEVPTDYPLEYWLMVPFFTSPLLWMAPSQLSPENADTISKLMAIYRQNRAGWRDAVISPVGSRPDGSQITGLYADTGYLLLFREKNAPESMKLDLPEFKQAEVIYSNSEVEVTSDGTVKFAAPCSAALIRLQ